MARWTREELLLALGLYFETPFGKQHKGYKKIIELAGLFGRTPSAVAMKLCNFTSLDPLEAERGISGLSGASNLDRQIWSEFENNKELLVEEIEQLREKVVLVVNNGNVIDDSPTAPVGPTSRYGQTTQRRHQNFFRRVVLGSYGNRCCITGLPIPELLRASHIVPWSDSEEQRLNPCNGLCLSATFDAAFDRGLISFDSANRLMLSQYFLENSGNKEVVNSFLSREGMPMTLPEKNLPDPILIQWHVENIFIG